jgi:predicted Zn-dependent peptidase
VRRTLPNGLEVVYVRHGTLPLVHATLLARGGTSADPASLAGLAGFTADMLDEGAAGMNALQLASALDLLGAQLGTGAGWDAASVDLQVLREKFPQALQLMADVAVRPDFPQAEVARKKEQRLTDLARARDEPRIIAANAFSELIYGANHPYGRIAGIAATRKLDRAAMVRFHQSYYRPEGSTLLLVGDVDPDALQPVVERAFGGWKGTAPSPAAVPAPPPVSATRIFLIDKPGAAQSEIRVGHPGVARSTADYFPLVVLNSLLGGSFTSRLNTNLRETHGFSYGASSAFSMRRGEGPFTAASAVFTAKTDSAVVEFFKELRRVREEPVAADELERARRYVALGTPRRFETSSDVAAQLAELEIYDLPQDFFNSYVQRVMAVTSADVQRVAREYLHPDRSVVVIVGDVQKIGPGIRALNLGPVEVREAGEFVK